MNSSNRSTAKKIQGNIYALHSDVHAIISKEIIFNDYTEAFQPFSSHPNDNHAIIKTFIFSIGLGTHSVKDYPKV